MFDIGGLELFLILIIALLVIGPERMPEVARQIGRFVGKTKRFVQSVKEESDLRETVEELRRELDLKEEAQALRNIEQDLQQDLYGNLRQVEHELQEDLDFKQLQRPSFGGKEPPPLHMENQDPEPQINTTQAAKKPQTSTAADQTRNKTTSSSAEHTSKT